LTLADIRWRTQELVVRHGKGDKDRVVPMDDDLAHWLAAWMEKRPANADTVFCTLRGEATVPRYWQDAVKRLATKAGLDPATVTPHVLRHCCATELLDDGCNIREVQAFLGHSSVATTQIYTHVRPAELGEKVRRIRRQHQAEPAPDPLAAVLATMTAEQKQALAQVLLSGSGTP